MADALSKKIKNTLGIRSPSVMLLNVGALFAKKFRCGLVAAEQEIKINNILRDPIVTEIRANESQYEKQIKDMKQYLE